MIDLARLYDHSPARLPAAASNRLDLTEHGPTRRVDLSKDDMLPVQMWRRPKGDEELAAVRVGAGVGHAERAARVVAEGPCLVFELAAPHALAVPAECGKWAVGNGEAHGEVWKERV